MINTVKRGIIAAMIFVVDLSSLIRDTGQQIDWDRLGASFRRGAFKVKLAEVVDIGETSVTVDALVAPLRRGQEIDFGSIADVVVTIGSAGATANDTAVPVDALSGPIPAGATISLGGKKFIRLSVAAVAGATGLTCDNIPTTIVDNDTGTYHGGDYVLKLAADAVLGATTITVEEPIFALPNDAEGFAEYPGYQHQDVGYAVPAGTVMARDAGTGKLFPRSLVTDGGETAECILLTDAKSDSRTDSITGYGVTYGGILYENLLPDAVLETGLINGTYKTELGIRFVWKVSVDNRGS